jgi:hypothetical protein
MSNQDDDLRINFYIKDPESDGTGDCETFYETDRGSWIVQAKVRPGVRDQLVSLAEDETFGEMSGRTVDAFVKKYVKERHGIDLA